MRKRDSMDDDSTAIRDTKQKVRRLSDSIDGDRKAMRTMKDGPERRKLGERIAADEKELAGEREYLEQMDGMD